MLAVMECIPSLSQFHLRAQKWFYYAQDSQAGTLVGTAIMKHTYQLQNQKPNIREDIIE